MKIISPFKDYYDFLAHTYGIDKNIVYNRQCSVDVEHLQIQNTIKAYSPLPCINLNLTMDVLDVPTYTRSIQYDYKHTYDFIHKNVRFKFHQILVLGSMFLCIEQIYPNKTPFFRIAKFKDILMYKKYKIDKLYKFSSLELFDNDLYKNKESIIKVDKYKNYIFKVHKTLGIPIISGIISDPKTNIIKKIYQPNLSRIQGFSGIVIPHELYKQLTNFFVELKEPIDPDPPVIIDNSLKIQKHGFDTKTSFRHPINIRKLKR